AGGIGQRRQHVVCAKQPGRAVNQNKRIGISGHDDIYEADNRASLTCRASIHRTRRRFMHNSAAPMYGVGNACNRIAFMGKYYPFFKAYDVRARVPDELDAGLARRIGSAYVAEIGARSVVVGHDMRLSSPALADAVIDGITRAGADVLDIGLCGTEEVYYATFNQATDGGIMVTASHNP